MKKIIAVDIDGTLVDSKKNLSRKTKDALIKAQENGHIVVIVTGRHYKGAEQYAKSLRFDDFASLVSCFNGARVNNFKTGKVLLDHKVDQDLLVDYLNFSKNLGANHIIYREDIVYTDSENSEFTRLLAKYNGMRHIYKKDIVDNIDFSLNSIVLFQEDPSILDYVEEKIRQVYDQSLNIVRSTKNFIEAMPKNINKGSSLLEIVNYYGLDIKDVIAFGDKLNDIEMIKVAGTGVAMGNANQVIKDLADYVTLTNDEDGIAHYLEKFNII